MEEKICCFTGYRPAKFPFELNNGNKEYNKLESDLLTLLNNLFLDGYTEFLSGMAMGFDIIAAECVLTLKQMHPKADIKLICVLPFINQIDSFDNEWKTRHTDIIREADDIIVLYDNYNKGCYQERNKFMVDRASAVVTWFDGKVGGTYNTLAYAAKTNKTILNLKPEADYDYSSFVAYEIMEQNI